jgi:glycosyltransferase involved in cell wall biosynthesis
MMRIFQNSGLYPTYIPHLRELSRRHTSFQAQVGAFLDDRFGACHFLEPVLDRANNAFFTNGDDEELQRQWAREHGMRSDAALGNILLAQVEEHRAEVFYNLDPMRYQSEFVKKLPSCVKRIVAWRAAPSPRADFSAYDLVVCNFPEILRSYQAMGWRTAWFAPAHDPVMTNYACSTDRPVDVLFVGGYTRHHIQRAALLEAVADLKDEYSVRFHLDSSRLTRWAESIPGRLLPLARHRRPNVIRAATQSPVFGLELYSALASAKIVLNGAIDMAGQDRGNMRCFEAMGCGGLLLSDEGNYPKGMVEGTNLLTYSSPDEAVKLIRTLLKNDDQRTKIARAGHEMIVHEYSKASQWERFVSLIQ